MTEMENSRCVEKWMNQDDIFNSLDYSSVRYKNRNITVLYQEYHTFVSYISGGFKLKMKKKNPRKVVKKFFLCYPQRNATHAVKTSNLIQLSK